MTYIYRWVYYLLCKIFPSLNNFYCLCAGLYVYTWACVCHKGCVEDNFVESVLSHNLYVKPGDQTRVSRLARQALGSLSHLASPQILVLATEPSVKREQQR